MYWYKSIITIKSLIHANHLVGLCLCIMKFLMHRHLSSQMVFHCIFAWSILKVRYVCKSALQIHVYWKTKNTFCLISSDLCVLYRLQMCKTPGIFPSDNRFYSHKMFCSKCWPSWPLWKHWRRWATLLWLGQHICQKFVGCERGIKWNGALSSTALTAREAATVVLVSGPSHVL